ncbi:MAG TPA: NUDIX domain-containing protein [Fulvivirga sp.]|nr:NUDIX domain-containing protein [Fulvivirga sp.]
MNNIEEIFGNRVRVRVCGICIDEDKLLLVNHTMGPKKELWLPPGGGINFNESAEDALIREFKEETGLNIAIEKFMFVNEFKSGPLHAIELFFKVNVTGGALVKGFDPELSKGHQIIKNVGFVSFKEIVIMEDEILHNILHGNISQEYLLNMTGYFKLWQ